MSFLGANIDMTKTIESSWSVATLCVALFANRAMCMPMMDGQEEITSKTHVNGIASASTSTQPMSNDEKKQIQMIVIICGVVAIVLLLVSICYCMVTRYRSKRRRGNGLTDEDEYARRWQKKYPPGSTIVRSKITSASNPKQNAHLTFAEVSHLPPVKSKRYTRDKNCVSVVPEKSKLKFEVPWKAGVASVCSLSITHLLPSYVWKQEDGRVHDVAYYEVTILQLAYSHDSRIAIGVASKPYPSFRLPGWNPNSSAVHSNDGRVHSSFSRDTASAEASKRPLSAGDTLGCGFVPMKGSGPASPVTCFYTLNGKLIHYQDTVKGGAMDNIYACVGADCDAELAYNFRGGFTYDAISHQSLQTYEKPETSVVKNSTSKGFSTILAIPLQPEDKNSSPDNHALSTMDGEA
ncbi:hypothetical protein SARC_00378 [Sphaeroforma arctica JP610]|uniref:SPRY domain-containing protein n=1 Tax=Sphaeroforma arctica JP610 TaxID=667725 RepID=A0A0L0GEP7_9EUKA|nr:hypothetical protein SARC_00378 [Sphaeroforma arctica JP610]KNC87492.1 hypothetical protein SARC_00378 [Sphaeroforma arctica JP610]|eukprot:XP_014161394.1 hypothetical protein SARC_00378 [Sphaeroforma arctica JP610]